MDRMLVSTKKGLFEFQRSARGWAVARTSFLGEPVTATLRDPRDGTLYAALRLGHFGAHLHRSTDDGATWSEIAAPAYPKDAPTDEKDGFGRPWPWKLDMIWILEPGHAREPGVLWAGTIPGGLFKSEDGGGSWSLVRSLWDDPRRRAWFGGGYDTPGIHSVCVHPEDGRRVMVGVSCGGVWGSDDGGASWELRARGMYAAFMPPADREKQEIQDPHRVVQCRARPQAMWAQHHNGVFRTVDGGASWQAIENVPPSTFGFACAVHPRDPDTAWLVPAQKDERRIPVDGRVVVARTRDGGKSWDSLSRGLPGEHAYDLVYRHALDIDDGGSTLAMGSTTGNLWLTESQGDDWQQLSAHLPPIHAVRFI
ncbi:MAG: WD40/YVTN/BNR-like repeat-containing protein [Polyangia bacterium]